MGNDNTVRYAGRVLQIPEQRHRRHFVKANVRVHAYPDGRLAVFHGPRRLARYEPDGTLIDRGEPGQNRCVSPLRSKPVDAWTSAGSPTPPTGHQHQQRTFDVLRRPDIFTRYRQLYGGTCWRRETRIARHGLASNSGRVRAVRLLWERHVPPHFKNVSAGNTFLCAARNVAAVKGRRPAVAGGKSRPKVIFGRHRGAPEPPVPLADSLSLSAEGVKVSEQATKEAADDVTAFGPFRLLTAQRLLLEGDAPVRLGSRACDILVALVERPGEVVSKQELLARVWPDTFVEEASIRVHVAALRRALGDGNAGRRYITNVPGRGYSFVAPVSVSKRASRRPGSPSGGKRAAAGHSGSAGPDGRPFQRRPYACRAVAAAPLRHRGRSRRHGKDDGGGGRRQPRPRRLRRRRLLRRPCAAGRSAARAKHACGSPRPRGPIRKPAAEPDLVPQGEKSPHRPRQLRARDRSRRDSRGRDLQRHEPAAHPGDQPGGVAGRRRASSTGSRLSSFHRRARTSKPPRRCGFPPFSFLSSAPLRASDRSSWPTRRRRS